MQTALAAAPAVGSHGSFSTTFMAEGRGGRYDRGDFLLLFFAASSKSNFLEFILFNPAK
jgi:hypothetical protein